MAITQNTPQKTPSSRVWRALNFKLSSGYDTVLFIIDILMICYLIAGLAIIPGLISNSAAVNTNGTITGYGVYAMVGGILYLLTFLPVTITGFIIANVGYYRRKKGRLVSRKAIITTVILALLIVAGPIIFLMIPQ